MLKKERNSRIFIEDIRADLGDGVCLFTKIFSTNGSETRTALLIHGGGVTGNHSLSERPSKWLINNNIFDKIILPDRRGAGASSLFSSKSSLKELAEDMKKLLDKLAVNEPVTAIGVSYGGPISLLLASIDPRIKNVILIASSPRLTLTGGKLNVFYRLGIMQSFIKLIMWMFTGYSNTRYVDMDFVYDKKTVPGLVMSQINILRQMNRKNLKSYFLMVDSVFDKNNMSIPENIVLNIPVLQIIGDKDTVWERKDPAAYLRQFPLFRQIIIKRARHRDVFFRAEEFLEKIINYEQ